MSKENRMLRAKALIEQKVEGYEEHPYVKEYLAEAPREEEVIETKSKRKK